MVRCGTCNNRVLSHSRYVDCSVCCVSFHVKCLPNLPVDTVVHNYYNSQWICVNCTADIFPFNHYDEDDMYMQTVLSFFGCELTIANLNNIMFNPFEINDDSNLMPLYEIDPDFHFFNTTAQYNASCNYYLEDSFNQVIKSDDVDNFSMIHLNIRSSVRNLENFVNYLKNLTIDFTIIGLSETWLTEFNSNLYGIDGYTALHVYRTNRIGGGVSIMIKNSIDFIERHDIDVFNECLETKFIELPQNVARFDKNVVIGVVYRPPNSDFDQFNDTISELLVRLNNERKYCVLMGDFNINLLNSDSHSATGQFLDILYANSLFPLITKPTRVQRNSATIIDNIFLNCNADDITMINGILYTDISDHFPIFTVLSRKLSRPTVTHIEKRDYSKQHVNNFVNALRYYNWSTVTDITDSAGAFTLFHTQFRKLYNKFFPLRKFKCGYKTKKCWLSNALKVSIKTKNRLYLISKRHPTEDNIQKYRLYKTHLQRLLRNAEKQYFHDLLEANKMNLKKSWSIIKNVINKKQHSQTSSEFNVNGVITSDHKVVADAFNRFFTNIGKHLSDKIPHTNTSPLSYMESINVDQSIYLVPTDVNEIHRILKQIKTKSAGWDEINNEVIMQSFHTFSNVLVHLVNLSLLNGVFPNEMKIAKVIPLYKNGNNKIVSNYRPVSILPIFSKLYERIIYNRIFKFVNDNDLLYRFQFGFRKNHSTTMALITLIDKIVNGIHDNHITLGTFLDFSKAFDTIDHKILLLKLNKYGIRGIANTLIASYLNNRKQFVSFNGTNSDVTDITCGVPQGSILGPLLFILYINDLHLISDTGMPILFADDSSLFIQGDDINTLCHLMNIELNKVYNWVNSNKLSLNIEKTHCMLFHSSRHNLILHNDIQIAGKAVSLVKSMKFLGIIIDSKLNWSDHLNHIRHKIAKGIGIIYKARRSLNANSLITMYYSFIYPYLTYAIELWGSLPTTRLTPILKLQKKTLRIISYSPKMASSLPLFHKYNILDVYKLYIYRIALFMFKFQKGECPALFNNMFYTNNEIHQYMTRQQLWFHIPVFRTNFCQRLIRYKGVIIFNHFSNIVSHQLSIISIKKYVKRYLLFNDVEL